MKFRLWVTAAALLGFAASFSPGQNPDGKESPKSSRDWAQDPDNKWRNNIDGEMISRLKFGGGLQKEAEGLWKEVNWQTSVDAALSTALAQNKPILAFARVNHMGKPSGIC
jgi:hypothetical protein